MLRLVLIAFCIVAALYLLVKVVKELREESVDWKGIGLAVVFILSAVYLRGVTEMGGVL